MKRSPANWRRWSPGPEDLARPSGGPGNQPQTENPYRLRSVPGEAPHVVAEGVVQPEGRGHQNAAWGVLAVSPGLPPL